MCYKNKFDKRVSKKLESDIIYIFMQFKCQCSELTVFLDFIRFFNDFFKMAWNTKNKNFGIFIRLLNEMWVVYLWLGVLCFILFVFEYGFNYSKGLNLL